MSLLSFFSLISEEPMKVQYKVLLVVFFIGMISVVGYQFFKFFEQIFVNKRSKPFYVFNHFYKRRLNKRQQHILETKFDFYKKLSIKHKRNFEHRVAVFVKDKEFAGREGLIVTDEMKILISSTAVMLTFGFRKYIIDTLETIIIYPEIYYSELGEGHHKGEFNPRIKTLVLSWEDFLEGYNIDNDNLNLGIHEMVHAIHLDSLRDNDISAYLFKNRFIDLTEFLQANDHIRKKLIETKYFREYAFTNQFEFLSVLVESFFETPNEFKGHFPEVYKHVKQMLNFNFAGY